MISRNLATLRKLNHITQEELAEKIGVSRQALAKWESGETLPDIEKTQLIAEIFNVSIDDLVNYSEQKNSLPLPPKGKHIFGVVTAGEKGQIVIPKKARKIFDINTGDRLVILGDEMQGIAIIKESNLIDLVDTVREKSRELD